MNRKVIFRWLAVLVWMGIIFYLSHQPATRSGAMSGGLLEWVLNIFPGGAQEVWLFSFLPEQYGNTSFLHFLIRKLAHLTAYFILGILVVNALRPILQKYLISIALAICIVYAAGDEFHQIFIAGRSGELRDVFIDTIGAFVGIVVFVFIKKPFR